MIEAMARERTACNMLGVEIRATDESVLTAFAGAVYAAPSSRAALIEHLRTIAEARESPALRAALAECEHTAPPASSPRAPAVSPEPAPTSPEKRLRPAADVSPERPAVSPPRGTSPRSEQLRLPVKQIVDKVDAHQRVRTAGVPMGLNNELNLCFFNSLAQAYFGIPLLRAAVLQATPKGSQAGPNGCTLLCLCYYSVSVSPLLIPSLPLSFSLPGC
jgi:hypothetical protein